MDISVAATDDIQTTPIPLDIALIVVAAIVSLGLTLIAVVMVLHMRSKLFETVRLAIYDDEKTKSPERENANSERMSTVVNSSLPREYLRIMPGRRNLLLSVTRSLVKSRASLTSIPPSRAAISTIVLTAITIEGTTARAKSNPLCDRRSACVPLLLHVSTPSASYASLNATRHVLRLELIACVISAPPIRANPVYAANAESETILTVDGIESLNTYSNGTATIGLRISGNLRGEFAILCQISHRSRQKQYVYTKK